MQILKIIKIKSFLLLTALNLAFMLYSFKLHNITPVIIFLGGIIINQLMLGVAIRDLLTKSAKTLKITFLIVGKFSLLVIVFLGCMHYFPDKMPTLLLGYTFQLIILVLSIKRKATKN